MNNHVLNIPRIRELPDQDTNFSYNITIVDLLQCNNIDFSQWKVSIYSVCEFTWVLLD